MQCLHGPDQLSRTDEIVADICARLKRLESMLEQILLKLPNQAGGPIRLQKRPPFMLSRLFLEYAELTKNEVRDLSPNQHRIWRNGRVRAIERFVNVVGEKPITDLCLDDGLDYIDWWNDKVTQNRIEAKTANKDIGQLSRMLKEVSVRRRLDLPDIFKGLRLKGEASRSRIPYETSFIQQRILGRGVLDGLNVDARLVLYIVADTGLRPSEVVNLRKNAICLDGTIPFVKILPDGRRLKTIESEREVPLVGTALTAMKQRPNGFARYRDRSSGLSATLNKYLLENGLRPTLGHTVYSLRHSFKDRLVAAEAPDSLIDSLMGHKTHRPKYGKGPSLELKLKYLRRIALRPDIR